MKSTYIFLILINVVAIATPYSWAGDPKYVQLNVCDTQATIELNATSDKIGFVTLTEPICTSYQRPQALITRRCAHNLDECLKPIFEKKGLLKQWKPLPEYGNPTFQLCEFLGGESSFARYHLRRLKASSTTLCRFKSQNIIVDLDDLYASYLRSIHSPAD